MTSAVKKEKPIEVSRQNFLQMESLACLGEILGGVAHEINNPLQIILGKAQILRMRMSEPQNYQKSIEDLTAIEKGAQRIAELVNCLNDLSCQAVTENSFKTDVDLNYLLNSILPLIKACLKDKKIELNLDLTEKLPKVKGNSLELKKLFMFLMLNAKQRINRGGKLGVNFEKEKGYLKVVFKDQAELSSEKIHTSSESTDSWLAERMLDFGILSSNQILQEHKGELETIGNPGKGDTLVARLPLI
jgi:signal transduction histidine kinase